MSTIQEQLVAYLTPTVALHPMVAPQGAPLPYATYQCVASAVNNVLSGPPSIDNTRIQVDAWAGTYPAAQALAKAIVDAMQAWPVQNILLNKYDLYAQEVQTYRVLLEFSIWQ